jgi:hypothetical protein
MGRLIPYLLTCGPFILTLAAWIKTCRIRPLADPLTWAALVIVTANAVLAAGTYVWYEFRPTHLPPWKDPAVLQLALLFFTVPIGMVVGLVAVVRGAPKWLIILLEIASLPLLVVGLLEGISV